MQLYIQQLEDRVRQLTGENERLSYEVNQLRTQLGMPPLAAGPEQTGAVTSGQAPAAGVEFGAPPQDLGSVAQDNPLNAPDGAGDRRADRPFDACRGRGAGNPRRAGRRR